MARLHIFGCALLLTMGLASPGHAQDASSATAADKQKEAQAATVTEAMEVMKTGEPARAIAMLDPVLADFEKAYPASGPAVFCGSDMSSVLTNLLGAAAARKDAVVLNDTWCYALWAKGYSLVELGRLDDALVPLGRAAQMMPDNAQFQTELGYVYQTLRHWNESNAAYTAAAQAGENIKDEAARNLALRRAWFGIGFNDIELGNLDAAEKHMKQALKYAPDDAKIQNELEYIRQQRAKAKGKRS